MSSTFVGVFTALQGGCTYLEGKGKKHASLALKNDEQSVVVAVLKVKMSNCCLASSQAVADRMVNAFYAESFRAAQ